MSEISDVLAAIGALHARGERMALATIVSVRGSTYRRPGARLLVPEHGAPVGNVSGGCLEGDVERIGREVMASGEPRLELFDLTADGDEVWGYGLGCNGAMELFIEPAEHAVATAAALRTAVEEERACCLVTVLASDTDAVRPGTRLLLHAHGRREGGLGVVEADAAAADLARRALETGVSWLDEISLAEGHARVFAEVLEPPPRLLVCGAGHDAMPLVRYASELGWRVTIADVRRPFLTYDRFPEAAAFLDVEPLAVADAFAPDARAFAVVMSHNYLRDIDYLRALLGHDLAYLGMLGPRKRTEQLIRELEAGGVTLTDVDRARIHAPAGLDLGAEGPEEVAWSIVAEMLAVRRSRAGGPLREREAPIHADEPSLE
ncbi:MAG: XdhC family protein, partial [Candidatus Limnocylindria bacterium]